MVAEAAKTEIRGTPLMHDRYEALTAWAINHSADSVKVSMFLLNLDPRQDHDLRVRRLVRALCDAAWRQVRVQVLVGVPDGRHQLRSNAVSSLFLGNRGIDVRHLRSRSHHLKFLVVDSKRSIVGSHNWTPSALQSNLEASVLIDDPAASRQISGIFDALWQDSEPLSVEANQSVRGHDAR